MAIITFCSEETKETGQTLSLAAIATCMAIEHNYKTIIISTNFNEVTLENCFWETDKIRPVGGITDGSVKVGITSGVEGLIKIIQSNKTTAEIVKDYSRTILRDRLDILLSSTTTDYNDYKRISERYLDIIQIANQYYDLVFVDLSKTMPKNNANEILSLSDVVVVNITQRLQTINDFAKLREHDEFYRKSNVILAVGRYDKFSKYNAKNITRFLRERNEVSVIPYNTLFFEACSEGKIIDFFLRLKNIDINDRNYLFMQEVNEIVNNILIKIQELQMKM